MRKTILLLLALTLGFLYSNAQVKDVRAFTYDATPGLTDSIPCINLVDRLIPVQGLIDLANIVGYNGDTTIADTTEFVVTPNRNNQLLIFTAVDNSGSDTTTVTLPATVPYDGWGFWFIVDAPDITTNQYLRIRSTIPGGDDFRGVTPAYRGLRIQTTIRVGRIVGIVGRGYYLWNYQ